MKKSLVALLIIIIVFTGCLKTSMAKFPKEIVESSQEYEVNVNTLLLEHFNDNYECNGVKETTATRISKESGKSGGLPTSGCEFVQGKFGNGIKFAEFGFMTYPLLGNISLNQGSLDFWVKPLFDPEDKKTDNRHFVTIIFTQDGSRVGISWNRDWQSVVFYIFDRNSSKITLNITARTSWEKDEWHHILLSWGERIDLYVDGERKSYSDRKGLCSELAERDLSKAELYIGSLGNWAQTPTDFVIDELNIQNIQFPYVNKNLEGKVIRRRSLAALYMGDFLRDGPAWRTQVDRIWLNFSGNEIEDRKNEMALAKKCGIETFVYNFFPVTIDKNIRELKQIVSLAQEVNMKIIPLVDNNPGVSHRPEDIELLINRILKDFKDYTSLFKINSKILIPIADADAYQPETWKKILDAFNKENNESSCYFIAQMRYIDTMDTETLEAYLKAGFSGILDSTSNRSPEQQQMKLNGLREVIDETIPAGGILVGSILGGYWRLESGIVIPPRGTSMFRESWETISKTPIDLINLMSWNDFSENHHIAPSLYMGKTRTEISKHYITLMNKESPPMYNDFHLYFSFRRSILAGEILDVELLNLPNNKNDYYVSMEVRHPTGILLKEIESPLINSANLQVVNMTVPTASLPSGTRVIELRGIIKDKTNKRVLLGKKIGFVVIEPIINRNFLSISKLITDIPDIDLQIEQKEDVIKISGKSKELLKDIHLMRGDFIQIKHLKNKVKLVKILVSADVRYDENNQRVNTPWEGIVSIRGGEIYNAEDYSPLTTGLTHIVPKSKTELIFKTETDGFIYPEGILLELSDNKNMMLDISFGQDEFLISLDELITQKNASYSFDNNKRIFMVSLTDEDNFLHRKSDNLEVQQFYRLRDMVPSSSLTWAKGPVEIIFARAMDKEGRWKDSTPEVISYNPLDKVINGYSFNWQNKKQLPVSFLKNESIIADWDFDKTTSTGVVPSKGEYDFPLCLAGKGDLSIPFMRNRGNERLTPKLVQDNGRKVLEFNGETNFAFGPIGIVPTASFHITVLVNPGRLNVLQSIFSDKRFNNAHGVASIYILPEGKVQGQYHNQPADTWEVVNSKTVLTAGEWYTIELTFDARELKLYINDKLEEVRNIEGAIAERPSWPIIGAEEKFSEDFHNYFKGRIAYVRIEAFVKKNVEF